MNRELKFRAWDPEKCWLSNGKTLKELCLKAQVKDFYWDDSLPIMQYTGLKDKNGKEIYEGDILQTICDDGTKLSTFEIFWQQATCSFKKKRDDGNVYELDSHQKHLQIIGNVYETPELLTAQLASI